METATPQMVAEARARTDALAAELYRRERCAGADADAATRAVADATGESMDATRERIARALRLT